MLTPAVAGLLTGLSLIVAIGAQNAYVLRQGLRRSHVGSVVAICAISDLVLISAGVSGVGSVVDHAGRALDVVRWLGVAFLLWYAAGALRRTLRPAVMSTVTSTVTPSVGSTVTPSVGSTVAPSTPAGGGRATMPGESRGRVMGHAVALTWLNPHVYLDTVLLLGSIAAARAGGSIGARWWFAAGAGLASIGWFSGLGFGARLLAPLLSSPRAWRLLDALIGATMLVVAARLIVL